MLLGASTFLGTGTFLGPAAMVAYRRLHVGTPVATGELRSGPTRIR